MPYLTKRAISSYIRSECKKRLRLDLSPDNANYRQERQAEQMPPKMVARPGLRALTDAGNEWELEKLADLEQSFGRPALVGQMAANGQQFVAAPLQGLLTRAQAGQFIVQAEYEVTNAFEVSMGINSYRATYNLDYGSLRPDVIHVLPAGSSDFEVIPDGTVAPVLMGDTRLVLRIVDIKLSAEPSPPYLAEVTYYSMTLAGWLREHGFQTRFLVTPDAAVWPGSHDASSVVKLHRDSRRNGVVPTQQQLTDALNQDLEPIVFGVFSPRIRRFLKEELPNVLQQNWRALEWHVDNRCAGCEYLGYRWGTGGAAPDPDHCHPAAQSTDHLSRVAFVSRGARGALEENQIQSVANLATVQANHVAFDSHHVLKATRTVVSGRAQSLNQGQASIPTQAGTSAIMPNWADLRIYLSADFDIGSGITLAFGLKATWSVGANRVPAGTPNFIPWGPDVYPVDQRDLLTEQRELLRLLDRVFSIMDSATQVVPNSTIQVYVWDSVTYDHLVRVIGRNLGVILQNNRLRELAWLFPPETVVPNPDASDRRTPITVVREVVKSVVAAPVPHYYSLLSVARAYHSTRTQAPYNQFIVPGFFEDPLTDQVPSERAHEIWSRSANWNQQLRQLDQTVRVRLFALESVTDRLRADLTGTLGQTAPRIDTIGSPSLPMQMSDDSRLWHTFARLNEALQDLKVQQSRAMPPHEREAKFLSAYLTRRLQPQQANPVLTQFGLTANANRFVYELAPGSREVKARDGDFSFALSPRSSSGFLDQTINRIANGVTVPLPNGASEFMRMEAVTGVTVRGIDRDNGYIVIDLNGYWANTVNALVSANRLNLSTDVMLDQVHKDFFIPRLLATLRAIGNPTVAVNNSAVANAIGIRRRNAARGAVTPVAEVLWTPQLLHGSQVQRNLPPVRTLLSQNGFDLNNSQWDAWTEALSSRLRLIWGPPGTGKSRTLKAVVLGALHEARLNRRPVRILITGPTYESIDLVLMDVYSASSAGNLAVPGMQTARLRSSSRPIGSTPPAIDLEIRGGQGAASVEVASLLQRLTQNNQITLVGGTVHQVHNLMLKNGGSPVREMFDLILVDEASQMDVANAALALAALAANGSVVVAGDPKQLPPIHQAEPPIGLEHFVGPIYSYFESRHNIQPCMLDVNYRSNSTIVELAHIAGYDRRLTAFSPNLEVSLLSTVPNSATVPTGWPQQLHWTPEWARLLNPAQKASAFVYDEGRSSQWNQFEADSVAALVWLLSGRLSSQLSSETDPVTGHTRPASTTPYSPDDFWDMGIGIVTPHRAQQGLIVSRLSQIFPGAQTAKIRDAVDTVERFQGQQRDVMIATFALGDPDAIRNEEEFLMSLNRFNVMASRARAKLIVLVSQQLIDHLPGEMEVLRQSALIKSFVDTFCINSRPMNLGYIHQGTLKGMPGRFRFR